MGPIVYVLNVVSLLVLLASANLPDPLPPSRYDTLAFTQSANVTTVTVRHPPINLVDEFLISDLHDLLLYLRATPEDLANNSKPKVVIFKSENIDFFLGHIDVDLFANPSTDAKIATAAQYVEIGRLFQNTTSTIFIAAMNGRAFGAGHELPLQMDMRFAGPNVSAGSIENPLGVIAGGGGELMLGTLTNKARALEYLVAAEAFDAPTGTRLGLWNNHFSDAQTLYSEVDKLAARIGLLPSTSLNQTKSSLAFLNPSIDLQDADVVAFGRLQSTDIAQEKIAAWLAQSQALGPFELGLPDSAIQNLYQ